MWGIITFVFFCWPLILLALGVMYLVYRAGQMQKGKMNEFETWFFVDKCQDRKRD